MNEFKIVSLRNRSDLNLNASIYFSSKWNIPKESYLKEINSYINKESVRKTYEVDFFARKNDKRIYIQACNSINNNDVLNREIKPFILLKDNIAKVIVVNDPYFIKRYDENNILFINIVDFLLDYLPNF